MLTCVERTLGLSSGNVFTLPFLGTFEMQFVANCFIPQCSTMSRSSVALMEA